MQVKEILAANPEKLEKVLNHFGYANLRIGSNEVRCGLTEESNNTSICIYLNEHLQAYDFARDFGGDLFSIIMEHRDLSFVDVLREIKSLLGIEIEYKRKEKKKDSLSGILRGLPSKKKEEALELYDEKTLDKYEKLWNKRFLKDGISIETQKKFDIRFDYETDRIVIPHRNQEGELCGIMGRLNHHSDYAPKYLPLIRHKKSSTLYGYSINYSNLYKADTIYIGESEKFVMQLDSMGYNNGVALAGSHLSKQQIMLLLGLEPKKVIFCYDEGLNEEQIKRNINLFKLTTDIAKIETYMMIDRKNKYLEFGSKDSPSDNGLEIWESLCSRCVERI